LALAETAVVRAATAVALAYQVAEAQDLAVQADEVEAAEAEGASFQGLVVCHFLVQVAEFGVRFLVGCYCQNVNVE
jgi:hypothetical protein